jgi:hypothetical protein
VSVGNQRSAVSRQPRKQGDWGFLHLLIADGGLLPGFSDKWRKLRESRRYCHIVAERRSQLFLDGIRAGPTMEGLALADRRSRLPRESSPCLR